MTATKTTAPLFTVGQRVWVYGYNIKGCIPATVTQVGRKLVTTHDDVDGFQQKRTFRINGGHTNDRYGHEWVVTDQQRADKERRDVLEAELKAWGLEYRLGYRLPLDALEAVAAALRDTLGEPAQARA